MVSSYGSKPAMLPLPLPLPSAPASLRVVGLLVIAALLASMAFLGLVAQSLGLRGVDMSMSANRLPLRYDEDVLARQRLARDVSVAPQLLQQLQLTLDSEDSGVRVSIAFQRDEPVPQGGYVAMDEATKAPHVTVEGSAVASADRYTYVLVDVDAPDPQAPVHAPFLHYILSDLGVDAQSAEDPLQRDDAQIVVVPYYPVSPPVGEHRYVSLLFRQDETTSPGPDTSLTAHRANFDVRSFATQHALKLVTSSNFYSRPAASDTA